MVNHKRAARIMREESLQCQVKRRWVRRTDSDHGFRGYPNRLKGLEFTGPNQVWVADVTHIRIVVGFWYLAVVIYLLQRGLTFVLLRGIPIKTILLFTTFPFSV